MYIFGIGMGMLLLAAKYGSFYLLTGGERQWRVPFTDQGIRDWVYKSSVRTGILDIAGGYIGAHVLVSFGGSIIAMIAMCTYIITCMAMIFSGLFMRKTKDFLFGSIPKKRRKGYYAQYAK